jgi:hypothetical protein
MARGLSTPTLNLTVLDDESRLATIGLVASCALVAPNNHMFTHHPPVAPACDIDWFEFVREGKR